MDALALSILSFFLLLLIASFTVRPAEKWRIPHTTFLVFVGIIIFFAGSWYPPLQFFQNFQLSQEMIFFVFLPTLLFESAFQMPARQMLAEKTPIAVLAIGSYLLSVALVSLGMWGLFSLIGLQIPFIFLLLFGAIISATDPVAVLAVFKKLGVTPRLTRLFEGESLFNDGTSWALFVVILEVILRKDAIFTAEEVWWGIAKFFVIIVGGFLFGIVMGKLFTWLIQKTRGDEVIQLTLTLIMAHLTFLLADSAHAIFHLFGQDFEISAIIATVTASIILGSYGVQKFSPPVRKMMYSFWEHFSFVANSLIFILIGLLAAKYFSWEILAATWLPILQMIGVVVVGRVISIYLPLGIMNSIVGKKSDISIPSNWISMLSWASLRGAIAVAAILMVPENLHIPGWNFTLSPKEFLDVLVISAILFTLFIKSITLESIVKKMGLSSLSNMELMEKLESEVLLINYSLEQLEELHKKGTISEENFLKMKEEYENEKKDIKQEMLAFLHDMGEEKNLLTILELHALSVEKKTLQRLLDRNEITEKTYWRLLEKLIRQEDRITKGEARVQNDPVQIETLEGISECDAAVRYQNARARSIIINKVIKRFSELRNIESGIPDAVFAKIIKQYEKWKKSSIEIEQLILKKFPRLVANLEKQLIEHFMEAHVGEKLSALREKSIITSKPVLQALEEKFHCHVSH